MTYEELDRLCAGIQKADPALAPEAQKHLDALTKPAGSLGRLEEIAVRLFCIARGVTPLNIDPAIIYTVAGDHGVAEEGVSPYPQAVTRQMVLNFLNGGAAINVLCKASGVDFMAVDAGCAGGPFAPHPKLLSRRLGDGTANFLRGQAMSGETALAALEHGINIALQAAEKGYRCVGAGEMGIANTTSATALFCAIYGLDPFKTAGPGAGSSPKAVQHKAEVASKALHLHAGVIKARDYPAILAALGGFEIGVMAGIMLGAAMAGLPVLVDGFISTAAFAVASAIHPGLADYAFLAHASAEPGFALVLENTTVRPLLNLEMRLGEGTGAALAVPILRASTKIFNDMATFSSANVSQERSLP